MAKKSDIKVPDLDNNKSYVLKATSSAKHLEGEFTVEGKTAKLLIGKGVAEFVKEAGK